MTFIRTLCRAAVLALVVTNPAAAVLSNYGVVVGEPVAFYLEPVHGEGRWPHYVIEVDTPEGRYHAVINVFHRGGTEQVLHREVAMAPFGNYFRVFDLAPGFHALPYHRATGAATGGALDLMRHPGVLADIRNTPWDETRLVDGADIPVFDELLFDARRVYIFGEKFENRGRKGVHDVHQNQGNDTGDAHARLNGRWQDGAIVIEYEPTRTHVPRTCSGGVCTGGFVREIPDRVLVMTRFRAQRDFTDANGHGTRPVEEVFPGSAPAGGFVDYGPFPAGQLEVNVTPTAGDPDVYVQSGRAATESSHRARSARRGGAEYVRDYVGGSTFVRVKASGARSRWELRIRYVSP